MILSSLANATVHFKSNELCAQKETDSSIQDKEKVTSENVHSGYIYDWADKQVMTGNPEIDMVKALSDCATSVSSSDVCEGDSYTVTHGTSNSCDGDARLRYYNAVSDTWTYGDYGTDQYDYTITGANIGTYTFRTRIYGQNGTQYCTSDVTVTVHPGSSADAGQDEDICNGESVTIGGSPTGSGGTGPYTYEWQPAAGLSSASDANPIASPDTTTTYTVIVTDENGCSSTDEMTITIIPSASPDAGQDVEYCYGGSVTIGGSPTASGGTTPYTYEWEPASGLSSTSDANPTASPDTTTTYTVIVTDGNGCSSTDDITVTVNPIPSVDAGPNDTICNGDSVTIGGSPTGSGGTTPYTYEWEPASGLSSTSEANPLASPDATTTYTVTLTDENGCTSVDSLIVSVNPSPAVDAGPNDTICNGDSITIGGSPTGSGGTTPYTYEWEPASGLSSASDANPTASPDSTTTYTVTLTDVNGCMSIDSMFIFVRPSPLVEAGMNDTICNGQSVTLGGSPTGSGGTGSLTYDWGPSSDLNNTSYANPIANPDTTTTYTVTVTDENGCSSIDSVTIIVNPNPSPNVNSNSPVCEGEDIELTESGGDATAWSWSGPNGYISVEQYPTISSAVISDGGIYSVTVADVEGCTASADVEVVVNPVPDATIVDPGDFCSEDAPEVLSAATSGGTWSGSGITDSESGVFDPTQAVIGDNIITYTVSNGLCEGLDQITITVIKQEHAIILDAGPFCYDDFTVQLETEYPGGMWSGAFVDSSGVFDVGSAYAGEHDVFYSYSGFCGDTAHKEIVVYPSNFAVDYVAYDPSCYGKDIGYIEFMVSGGTEPYTYHWDEGSSDTAFISGLSAGEYNFTITDANGCSTEVSKIHLNEGDLNCLEIPNAFTPNGDGVNDTWIIENLEYHPKATVQVFNRWGQLLYQGRPETDFWDGTHKGRPVPMGSYMYVIRPSHGLDDIVGIVTVVR